MKDLSAYVSQVRAYLATAEGRREVRRLGLAYGLSYQAALAQIVVGLCGLVVYEAIQAVVDEVVIQELAA